MADDPNNPTPPAGDTPPPAKTAFTQDELNAIMKKEREKYETKIQESTKAHETLMKQIEEYQKSSKLSDDQKVRFQEELEQIRQAQMTAEQRAQEEKVKASNKIKELEDNSRKVEQLWRGRHDSLMTDTEIMRASSSTQNRPGVRQVEPVVALLKPLVQVEEKDGRFVPLVKNFGFTNKKGEVEIKDVTIEEAIDNLYNNEKFRYLFNDARKNGPGPIGNDTGDIDDPNNPPKDPSKYKAWRDKHKRR